jgi:sugar lactone lactonase YvrE
MIGAPFPIVAGVSPGTLTFSGQSTGTTSAAQTVTLTNTGTNNYLIVSAETLGGTNSGDFAEGTNTCKNGAQPGDFLPGQTCTVQITFTPSATGTRTATLSFADNATTGSPQVVTLSGTGTGPALPAVTFSPTSVAFGNQVVNTTSSPSHVVVLTNSGTATMTGIAISITGANPTFFGQTNNCSGTLAAGASCNISVTFTPASAVSYAANLSVADNAAGSPQTVPLTGTGSVAATPTPSVLVFNPVAVGVSAGSAQTLTASFLVSGYIGSSFTPTAALHYGLSYSAGAVSCTGGSSPETCTVAVKFQPQYPGGRREALFLMNGTTRIATVLIYGIGQSPFALVQPGVVTNPILSGPNYLYTSTVDENGTVYVLGDNSNSVFAVTKAGAVSTLPITGLNSPRGIGIDGAGVLYIADQTYNGPTITWDTVQNVRGTVPFAAPSIYVQSLTVGNTGNLYETDASNVYTVPITGSGTASTKAINPAITQAYIMAVDSNENVFVGGYEINEITVGGVETQVNTIGAGDGLGVDAADTLYATRYTGTTGVAELPATGYSTFEAALDLGSSPLGTSVGGDGTLYVGNYTNLDKVDRSQGLIAFGEQNQTLGTAGTQQIVTIYNGGNQTLTISNIAISGSPFSIQTATGTNCSNGSTVAPGALCQIAVVVTPLHAGVFNGSITVTSNSLNNASTTQTIALTAYTYGVYVTAAPNPLNFPSQIVNTTSSAQTVTLTNNGDLYSAYINGGFSSTSSAFTVTTGTCGSQIGVGATCQLNVTFTPTLAQPYSSTITFAESSTGGGLNQTVSFTVTGTGIPAAAPQAVLSPAPLAFPGTILGASTTLPLTLSNPGTGALSITSIAVTGTNAASFAQTNNCGSSLAAAGSCTITVTYTPTSIAAANASISVADNASGSPHTAALTGTGMTFVSNVGTALAAQPVTLLFTTAGTLNSIQVLTQGASGFDFTSATGGTCATGTAYTIGQSCTVNVVFTPKFAGVRAGAVLLTDGSGNALATTNLPGMGLGPQIVFGPGAQSTIVPVNSPYVPTGVAVDGSGNIYFANSNFGAGTNGVFKVTKSGTTYGAPAAVGTGYNSPQGVTVDGSGNVYVGDSANHRVVKVPWTGSGYGTQTTVPLDATPNRGPQQVVIDSLGNVYFADPNYGTVDEVPWTGSGYGTLVTLPFTGLNNPHGVAVDGSGNVFCADTYNNRVLKLPRTTGGFGSQITVATLTTGNQPLHLALDGGGDIYVSVSGSILAQIPWNGSVYGAPVTLNLTGLGYGPYGVATDGAGNVVVGGSLSGNVLRLDRADAPALSFATTNVGSTSSDSPQTVTVQNIGNTTFVFTVPGSGTNPSYPVNFPVNSADTSLCSFGLALAQSATCDVSVNFKPTTSGSLNGNVVLTDNQLNVSNATQSIAVSGTANPVAAPVATLSPNPLAFSNTTLGSTTTALPVTLSNTGNATLTGISFSIAGTNPTDFATTSATTCGTTLAAGSSCIIYVTFTPASVASFSATLTVADNASGSPQTVTLTGAGTSVPTPQAALSPNPLAFPGTSVGTAAATLPMTLSNPGSAALTITSISVTGTNASSFGQSNNCGASLAAGASCTITVTFTPASAGSLAAAISVVDNATGSPHTAALTGTGTAPETAFTSSTLTFPSTLVGTSATTQSTTLSNPGTAALTITSISVTGVNSSSFGESNNCGTSRASGASCTITVTFTPASAGGLSASVAVADNATGSPQTVALTGTGTAPQAVLSPNPLAFPSTLVGTAATALPMTLSNPGTAALTISSISVTGTNSSSFGQTNNCGTSLAVGASCTITVTFTPASAASLAASISVADNATGSPQAAAITGTGTAPLIPQAVFGPASLTFPTTTINTSATPLPITLSNPGNTPLIITSISVTGTNASSFGQSNNCPASLAAGASCTITVTFAPASAATFNAAISVADNAAGSPQSAVISGIGSAGTYVVNSSTPSVSIQPGAVAQFNIQVNPLGGTYNNLVTLSATGLPAGATVVFLPPSVTPGSAGSPSVMSVQTASGLARLAVPEQRRNSLPLLALLAGIPLLGIGVRRRRFRRALNAWMLLVFAALAILPMLAISGCGGGYFGPAPKTYTLTVVGTSGSLQESTTVTLTVQ